MWRRLASLRRSQELPGKNQIPIKSQESVCADGISLSSFRGAMIKRVYVCSENRTTLFSSLTYATALCSVAIFECFTLLFSVNLFCHTSTIPKEASQRGSRHS